MEILSNTKKLFTFKYLFLLVTALLVTSCGSFGEGLLMGLSNVGGYGYGYGGNSYITPSSGGNMNYLLDPNYAAAQVFSEEENEYQTFCKYNKKADGSNYTKSEWLTLKGQAIQNMNSGASVVSTGTTVGASSSNVNSSSRSSSTNSSSSSSGKTCHMCHGTKKCWTCGGNMKYINPYTGKYVACPNCTTGWCSKCGGTGRL